MVEAESEYLTRIENTILSAITPEFFRYNIFRILEVQVNASQREIDRRFHLVEIAQNVKVRLPTGNSCLYPIITLPSIELLTKQLQQTNVPELRILYELFWFWPAVVSEDINDEALEALRHFNKGNAVQIWAQQEKGVDSQLGMHNLAVYGLIQALDWEKNISVQFQVNYDNCWLYTYARWLRLCQDDRIWSRLENRINELNDPRLPSISVSVYRHIVPQILLTINAELARRAAVAGNEQEAKHQVQIMMKSGVEISTVISCLRRTVKSTCQHLRLVAKNAEVEGDADQAKSGENALRLVELATQSLNLVDCLLPGDDVIRVGLHDEVARRIHGCVLTYCKDPDSWQLPVEALQFALKIASSQNLRLRIQSDLVSVTNNYLVDR